ncbi:Anaerobic dimethyl sulfoxide reductase chain B [bioreactor metagenome]|uniref:Anaerobic dimethyl sulfoxide reductase chain B n=2 Tax=root TaxID=1 RepID=A0A098AXX6_DESHA|nr:DMSO/selenate family reductase complex B subunit [Desulfitobacterium hafniense]MEA5025346.1 DMSO/selenate family reductase complex B subunit [Desulfitobacterium hafniense]CDX01473.1 Anaerobic dimethyl sulfoxide reductase chain B [Desulfitobacterium hafniense]
MAKQYGFYVDQHNCIGCFTCQIACKDKNDLADGLRWRKVHEFTGGSCIEENGVFKSNVFAYWLSLGCNHCEHPKCAENCPTGAMYKREEDGIVLVDQDKCIGCGYCTWSCPYEVPQVAGKTASKCNFCIDLQKEGKNPACVDACIMRVLKFGPLDELRAEYGEIAQVKGLPSADITKPSLVITPHKAAIK